MLTSSYCNLDQRRFYSSEVKVWLGLRCTAKNAKRGGIPLYCLFLDEQRNIVQKAKYIKCLLKYDLNRQCNGMTLMTSTQSRDTVTACQASMMAIDF